LKYSAKNDKNISQIIEFVSRSGGIKYAWQKMNEFQSEAFDILDKFPDTESKTALEQLVKFTTEREK
jgi:octaprenyl-diphosphate synthase